MLACGMPWYILTVFLNSLHSSGVRVSALAIKGMIFTLSCRRFINSTSNGLSLKYSRNQIRQSKNDKSVNSVQITYPWPLGEMKYKQQCTLLSGLNLRFTRDSAFKNSSYLASINWIMGSQLKQDQALVILKRVTQVTETVLSCGHTSYQLLLSTASPKPGVSTMVNRN